PRLDLTADGGEDGRLVGRAALIGARVDVHHRGARLVRAAGFLGDLGGRVRDPRALVAGGEDAGQRAGDDYLVRHPYLPFHSGSRLARNAETPSAASSRSPFRLSCAASASSSYPSGT